mmetsp:Transcript_5999/g.14313  ORF Transcript_5999/g.14313 Transcript_5999/m.14313 type:complete len:230 (-) Transcript_5999:2804-3493(-)
MQFEVLLRVSQQQLALGLLGAPHEILAAFLDKDNDHERPGPQHSLVPGEGLRLEQPLCRAPIDHKQREQDLQDDAQVQPLVREPIGEQRRSGGCRSQRSTDLSQNQRPIVRGHPSVVGLQLHRGVGRCVATHLSQSQHLWHRQEDAPARNHLHHSNVPVGVHQQPSIDHVLLLRVSGLVAHQGILRRLASVGNGSPDVRADVHQEHLGNGEGSRHAQQLGERRHHLGDL